MAPNIHLMHGFTLGKKAACFDYDWTLIKPKSSGTYTLDEDDWQWMYPNVVDTVRGYHEDGYSIVIFTNQSKEWKEIQILKALAPLKIPMAICIAFDAEDKKPNPVMFDAIEWLFKTGVILEQSFFVGDALGREGDFGSFDRDFAHNIGLRIFAPEDFFPKSDVVESKQE